MYALAIFCCLPKQTLFTKQKHRVTMAARKIHQFSLPFFNFFQCDPTRRQRTRRIDHHESRVLVHGLLRAPSKQQRLKHHGRLLINQLQKTRDLWHQHHLPSQQTGHIKIQQAAAPRQNRFCGERQYLFLQTHDVAIRLLIKLL
jgi:hypothetical protein